MATSEHGSMISDARRISGPEDSLKLSFNMEIKNRIFSNLHEDDLWKLKLLLRSFKPINVVDTISTFEELDRFIDSCESSNRELALLLAELLFTIQRFDLLKHMNCCKHLLSLYLQTSMKLNHSWINELKKIENSTIDEQECNEIFSNSLQRRQNFSSRNETRPDQVTPTSPQLSPSISNSSFPSTSAPSSLNKFETYPWKNSPCGLAVIINNEKFHTLDDRIGSTQDKENLEKMFKNFDFKVEVLDDLKADEIKTCISNLKTLNFEKYDAFALCILSHGIQDKIIGVDGQGVRIDEEIIYPMCDNRNKSLILKPKLFFIQACQGDKSVGYDSINVVPDNMMPDNSITSNSIESDGNCYIPKYGDYIKFMATIPGYFAYRSKSKGTWFIHHLTSVLNQHGHECSLSENLIEVRRRISEEISFAGGNIKKQRSVEESTLTKIFKFKKKETQFPVENEFEN